jgi:hypothetical protein
MSFSNLLLRKNEQAERASSPYNSWDQSCQKKKKRNAKT